VCRLGWNVGHERGSVSSQTLELVLNADLLQELAVDVIVRHELVGVDEGLDTLNLTMRRRGRHEVLGTEISLLRLPGVMYSWETHTHIMVHNRGVLSLEEGGSLRFRRWHEGWVRVNGEGSSVLLRSVHRVG